MQAIESNGLVPEPKEVWQSSLVGSMTLHGLVSDGGKEVRYTNFPKFVHKENQGPINACAANSGTTCAEGITFLKTGHCDELSRWFTYIEGTKACGLFPQDAGCTLSAIVAILKRGIPSEKTVPYPRAYDRDRVRFSDIVYAEAARQKMASTVSLEGGYRDWRTALGQNIGLVLLGVNWPLRTEQRDGYKYAARYSPAGRGGHAIAAVGLANSSDSDGRPDVWIANSHPGDEIYLVSATFIEELSRADPFGNVGITDLTQPIPRRLAWTGDNSPFK